jgi:hypothetical protein
VEILQEGFASLSSTVPPSSFRDPLARRSSHPGGRRRRIDSAHPRGPRFDRHRKGTRMVSPDRVLASRQPRPWTKRSDARETGMGIVDRGVIPSPKRRMSSRGVERSFLRASPVERLDEPADSQQLRGSPLNSLPRRRSRTSPGEGPRRAPFGTGWKRGPRERLFPEAPGVRFRCGGRALLRSSRGRGKSAPSCEDYIQCGVCPNASDAVLTSLAS